MGGGVGGGEGEGGEGECLDGRGCYRHVRHTYDSDDDCGVKGTCCARRVEAEQAATTADALFKEVEAVGAHALSKAVDDEGGAETEKQMAAADEANKACAASNAEVKTSWAEYKAASDNADPERAEAAAEVAVAAAESAAQSATAVEAALSVIKVEESRLIKEEAERNEAAQAASMDAARRRLPRAAAKAEKAASYAMAVAEAEKDSEFAMKAATIAKHSAEKANDCARHTASCAWRTAVAMVIASKHMAHDGEDACDRRRRISRSCEEAGCIGTLCESRR